MQSGHSGIAACPLKTKDAAVKTTEKKPFPRVEDFHSRLAIRLVSSVYHLDADCMGSEVRSRDSTAKVQIQSKSRDPLISDKAWSMAARGRVSKGIKDHVTPISF